MTDNFSTETATTGSIRTNALFAHDSNESRNARAGLRSADGSGDAETVQRTRTNHSPRIRPATRPAATRHNISGAVMKNQPLDLADYGELTEADWLYLVDRASVNTYPKGAFIIMQGIESNALYLLLAGEVEIVIENDDKRSLLGRLDAKNFFGELALLSAEALPISVVTASKCQIAILNHNALREALAERPGINAVLMKRIGGFVRELTERIGITPLRAYERFRYHLLRLAKDQHGKMVVSGCWTHSQLAELVSCVREHIAKLIGELRSGGYITLDDDNRIVILKALPRGF